MAEETEKVKMGWSNLTLLGIIALQVMVLAYVLVWL